MNVRLVNPKQQAKINLDSLVLGSRDSQRARASDTVLGDRTVRNCPQLSMQDIMNIAWDFIYSSDEQF